MTQVLAFSGGKDSTALALRMAGSNEDFGLLFTPTGDELPECIDHIAKVVLLTGKKIVIKSSGTSLLGRIKHYETLPNHQMRWCTRELKIEPAKAYLLEHPGSVLCVGLRADEEEREGMWGEHATYRYPLREWGWGIEQVYGYLSQRGVTVPERTDCGCCYAQRLSEWWRLWKERPDRWANYESLEEMTGHTFRSAQRDSWPAGLKEMRLRFEAGDVPRDIVTLPLFGSYDIKSGDKCRVCSL